MSDNESYYREWATSSTSYGFVDDSVFTTKRVCNGCLGCDRVKQSGQCPKNCDIREKLRQKELAELKQKINGVPVE